MEFILTIIFNAVMTIILLGVILKQHKKTRKDQQEIKVRLSWIRKRQIDELRERR